MVSVSPKRTNAPVPLGDKMVALSPNCAYVFVYRGGEMVEPLTLTRTRTDLTLAVVAQRMVAHFQEADSLKTKLVGTGLNGETQELCGVYQVNVGAKTTFQSE